MSEEINICLPPNDKIDWDQICYCMVLESTGVQVIYGVGRTIEECRNNALKYKITANGKIASISLTKNQMLCDLDTGVKLNNCSGGVIMIRMCDMKLYQNCMRHSVYRVLYYKDPFIKRVFLRFAGLRGSEK